MIFVNIGHANYIIVNSYIYQLVLNASQNDILVPVTIKHYCIQILTFNTKFLGEKPFIFAPGNILFMQNYMQICVKNSFIAVILDKLVYYYGGKYCPGQEIKVQIVFHGYSSFIFISVILWKLLQNALHLPDLSNFLTITTGNYVS